MARDVAGCERMMKALVTDFATTELESLAAVRVGVAWTDRADPLVRERVEAAAALFADRCPVDLPLPERIYDFFAREAVEVHAELYREHRALYGENVATKLERALALTDEQVAAARDALARYRERIAELTAEVDLVLSPTVPMVAPPTGIGDLALRGRMIELTFPWSAVGAPALAIPCGAAEDGLPASVQLAGRPGDDALVLAAGRLLEAALGAA
jgi:aspartyl-tRNA(Asn)/glutamyl-tRNA(Gln) amidotransferase subunit A